jgi:hypothetical protein
MGKKQDGGAAARPSEASEPKVVETIEQVEELSPEEIQQFDEHLQEQSATTSPVSETLASQGSSGFRTIQEIEADLKKPVPKQYLRKLNFGPAKGATYVPWMIVERMLSYYAPGWSTHSTGFSTPIGTTIITELTIPTATGPVTRAGHGFEPHQTVNAKGEVKDTGFGGAAIIASRQAFKRAAVAFGLARDLYPI